MMIDRIYEWARIQPAKAALIHNGVVRDYITFARAIAAFRKYLEPHHLPTGTVAVVLVNNFADAWALVPALRSLGLTTMQVNSLAQAKTIGIKNISCVVTIVPPRNFRSAFGLLNKLTMNYAADPQSLGAKLIAISRRDLAATPPQGWSFSPQSNRPSGGHIFFTSGTTGAFKKLMWDSGREEARISARCRANGFDKTTVAYLMAYEQQCGIGWKIPLAVWQAGGCVVFDQRPDWCQRFFDHAITHAFPHPSSFRALVDTNKQESHGCEILLSSGFLGSASIAKAITKFGDHLSNFYGSTELITPPLITRIRHQGDALWFASAADRTVQIVDDGGHECSPGQEGDLRILTTEIDWQCYLDDEEATSKIFRDGFFYPGDRAVRRADGRIRILGRVADVLNFQGVKVAVGPIEQRIRQHLEVDEVCVFSGLNAAGQDELVIAIKCDREPPKKKIDSISREFGAFEKVRFAFLKEFPRTETGLQKVRRTELRKLVFSESGDSR
jgi:acyl-coenzyme A synthetase/AMP-(fatty) acid ligase